MPDEWPRSGYVSVISQIEEELATLNRNQLDAIANIKIALAALNLEPRVNRPRKEVAEVALNMAVENLMR